jgi:catechol 2,3-dioxygenase-like lactoylglutathione lyase family enzyme
MQPPIKVLSIAEIVLNVRSIPPMRDFYVRVFGFSVHSQLRMVSEEAVPDDHDPTICFLNVLDTDTPLGRNLHPQMLVLIDYQRHYYAKRFRGVTMESSSLNHLAFEIPEPEFDAVLASLRQAGTETSLTSFPDLSARSIFFSDPEGNRLELICHVEPC